MKIIIARHFGFCMGVKRAIAIAEDNATVDDKVTIFREIVHNDAIVERFKKMGIGQSDAVENIDRGTVIIPAHGASASVFDAARARGLNVVNATCPLVIRIQKIVKKLAQDGYLIVHFGDRHHDETIGIVGHAPDNVRVIGSLADLDTIDYREGPIALTSQTTARQTDFEIIVEEVRKRYPQVEIFNTICDATSQRQEAIMELAGQTDLMLVVGSTSSANSNRLVRISRSLGVESYLINSAEDIREEWFVNRDDDNVVGLSAGASTPDFLIEGVIARLQDIVRCEVEVVLPPRQNHSNRLALDGN
jgi:4-hydroxy-3-methylbut-2-enyl diphosphate reductase